MDSSSAIRVEVPDAAPDSMQFPKIRPLEIVWQGLEPVKKKRNSQDKSSIAQNRAQAADRTLLLPPCSNCRARKKRCFHNNNDENRIDKDSTLDLRMNADFRESSPNTGRVSEYNPEAILEVISKVSGSALNLDDSLDDTANDKTRRGRIEMAETNPYTTLKAQRRLSWYKRNRWKAAPTNLSEHHRRYLVEVGAFRELPRTTTDGLLPLYVSLLDDLIPIVDGARVFRDHSNGQASIFLVRAMCLVICKTKEAAPFLHLSHDGPLLPALDFASGLLAGLDAAIKADLEPDRVVVVQTLALMHLCNDGLAGVDRSSNYLSQAISEAWSLSLHLKIPGIPDQHQCNYLWWSLRNLDRLNKPVMTGAAPFIIDDSDVSIDRIQPNESSCRSQLMGLTIILGDLMAMATKVYKASSTRTTDDCRDFPSFSEITSNTYFPSFHRSHKAYLEIWYHVAAMLSCRHSGPGSIQYRRSFTSANRILEIFSQEGYEHLPPLPLIPYAMSMSTTILYRSLYDHQCSIEVALNNLHSCCRILNALSQRWTSAKGVTELAMRLWTVLTGSEKPNEFPANWTEQTDRNSRVGVGLSKGTTEFSTESDRRNSEVASADKTIFAIPINVQNSIAMNKDEVPDNSENSLRLPIDTSPELDTFDFYLDEVFQELFDYNLPISSRDPT